MRPDREVLTRPARDAWADAARGRWLDWLLPAAAFALALAIRLRGLDESCLWFDELFGLHAARHEWGGLLRFVVLDLVHPPLFYLLLKAWRALGGESVWWLRLLPALLSSLAVVPLALLGRELRLSARAVALALALAAASGFLIKYAQEVRMYAPLVLLASCSLWLFARISRAGDEGADGRAGDDTNARAGDEDSDARDSGAEVFVAPAVADEGGARLRRRKRLVDLVALACANLLLVYTHYFGWLLVALELAFAAMWARSRLKLFAASVLLIVVCFAPWAREVALAAAAEKLGGGLEQNIGWAARPGALELFLPYLLLHEPFRFQRHSAEPAVLRLTVVLSLLIFAPALAALAVRELKRALATRELRRRLAQTPARTTEVGRREGDAASADMTSPDDAASKELISRGDATGDDLESCGDTASVELMSHGDAASKESASRGGAAARAGYEDRIRPPARENFVLRFLIFFAVAPVVASFALSQVLPQSVWGTRHLVVVAPAYLLLAAHAVVSLRPRWLAAGVQLLLGCWLLLASAGFVTRRPATLVWCSWETLAAQLARDEAGGGHLVNVYATEELAAYHLWHALDGTATGDGARFRVAVVRNAPGVAEDRAFFLPRGFDAVSNADVAEVTREDDFWIAFRAPAAGAEHPLLRALAARGYEITRRLEASAQGQRVTLARMKRD